MKTRTSCINCRRQRACLLFEVSVPCDDGVHEYEVAERVPICRACITVTGPEKFIVHSTVIDTLLQGVP